MGVTSNDSSMSPVSSPSSTMLFLDLYGRRRQLAKVQVLQREIALLQDEIKSLADLEPASRCCKELDDYVEVTPDPLVSIYQIPPGGSRNFWKDLRKKIGSMLRCCCCCNIKACCKCFTCRKDCCWGGQKKTRTSGCCKCPKYNCSCNPTCAKCLVCCCCKPCSCF